MKLNTNIPNVSLSAKTPLVSAKISVAVPLPSIKLPNVPKLAVSVKVPNVSVKMPTNAVAGLSVTARIKVPTISVPGPGMAGIMDAKVNLSVFQSTTVTNLSAKVTGYSPGKSIFKLASKILATAGKIESAIGAAQGAVGGAIGAAQGAVGGAIGAAQITTPTVSVKLRANL